MARNPISDCSPSGISAAEPISSVSRPNRKSRWLSRICPHRGPLPFRNVSHGAQETACLEVVEAVGVAKQDQDRLVRVEVRSQRLFEAGQSAPYVVSVQQPQRQPVNLFGQRVIGTRDIEEFPELALVLEVFLPEQGNLSLDQRNRRAGAVRQPDRAEQIRVTLEEIRVVHQVIVDRVFRQRCFSEFRLSLRAH
jgi:hypothetical protein